MHHPPRQVAGTPRRRGALAPRFLGLSTLVLLAGAGCEDGSSGAALDPQRARGQSDFQTAVGSAGLPGGGQNSAEGGRGSSDPGTATGGPSGQPGQPVPPPTAPGVNPDSVSGPMDPGRLVEEGDVVKVVGNTLYVLNEYRGLQVVDISDPDKPVLLSRVDTVLGHPEDMYLRGGMAIALVSDHRDYAACPECAGGARPYHGSAAAFIDVTNPRAATLRSQVKVPGTLSDSRIVGDVLYVVSQLYTINSPSILDDGKNATTVLSFQIADPAKPVAMGKLEVARGGWQNHVHVTDKLLYLASSGYGSWMGDACVAPTPPPVTGGTGTTPGTMGSTGGGSAGAGGAPSIPPSPAQPPIAPVPPIGDVKQGPCSRITAVDIAAADGSIVLGAHVDVPGAVLDRWSMDHHLGVLRVVTAPPGNGMPRISTFKSGSAGELVAFGPGIDVPVPRPEELKAVRFDGGRAFVVTFQRIDPLFIFDLSNPEAPRKLGELETPGWVDFIEPRGDRLVALGHDQMMPGTGGRAGWVLSASVYDVSDLSQPKLMSRELFDDAATIPDRRDNLHKVFRVFDEAKLILMPYQAYLPPTPTVPFGGGSVGRVQLLDLDLPAGKVTKRGFIPHDSGVERALLHGDQVLALSPRQLKVVDISNRADPRTRGVLRLASNVREVVSVGSDLVTVSAIEDTDQTLLELHAADGAAPGTGTAKASLSLTLSAQRIFVRAGALHVVGTDRTSVPTGPGKVSTPTLYGGLKLVVVDTAGGKLTTRGTLDLPRMPALDQRSSLGGAPLSAALLDSGALVFTLPRESCGGGSVDPGLNGSGVGTTAPPPPSTATPMSMPGSAPTMSRPDAGAVAPVDAPSEAGPANTQVQSALIGQAANDVAPQCPPHEADFLVVDVRNPDAPAVAAKFKVPGASDVMGAAAVGSTYYIDHFEQVPGFDSLNRVIVAGVRFFVTRVDLADPASPRLEQKINVPGVFAAERLSDRSWFTLEPRRNSTSGNEDLVLHALYQPPGQARAFLESSLPLPGQPRGQLVFNDRSAFTMSAGQLLTIDLANPRMLTIASRTTVPGVQPGSDSASSGSAAASRGGERPIIFSSGWATVGGLVGQHLVLDVNGGSLIYDVKEPTTPRLLGFVRGGVAGGRLHPAPAGSRSFLPAGLYGMAPLPQ